MGSSLPLCLRGAELSRRGLFLETLGSRGFLSERGNRSQWRPLARLAQTMVRNSKSGPNVYISGSVTFLVSAYTFAFNFQTNENISGTYPNISPKMARMPA